MKKLLIFQGAPPRLSYGGERGGVVVEAGGGNRRTNDHHTRQLSTDPTNLHICIKTNQNIYKIILYWIN